MQRLGGCRTPGVPSPLGDQCGEQGRARVSCTPGAASPECGTFALSLRPAFGRDTCPFCGNATLPSRSLPEARTQ